MSQEVPQENGQEDINEGGQGPSRGLIIGVIVAAVIVILLLVLALSGVFSGADEEVPPTDTAEPIESYITILEPAAGTALDIANPITVKGSGAGLFEGNVVVQALDEHGSVLAEGATTIDSPEAGMGGEGPWQIALSVQVEAGTLGMIRAYSPSPADGSIVAEDSVGVKYGEAPEVESFIKIGEPADGSLVDSSAPVIVKGEAGGLHEGSLVVQMLDEQDNVLAEETTSINAPDAGTGAAGPWQVELNVDVEPGTAGKIRAFSTSPDDDSVTAQDSVQVKMGETPQVKAYIKIEEPVDGAVLDISKPVIVRGMGAGLFEGNVVLQALDEAGAVLVEQATIIDHPEAGIGGEGPWQVELTINTAPGTPGTIKAFSPSPVDGSMMAEDSVSVTYSEEEIPEEGVKLEEHLWLLMTYNGKQVLDGTMITAEFEDDQVAGAAGCNNYFAAYETSNGSLTIGPAGSTMKFCESPEDVMEQEYEYLSALQQSAAYKFEDGVLEISDAAGEVILVYEAAVVGNVVAAEDSVLPEGATAQVTLSDVSLQDVAAKVIGERVIENPGQFPFPYVVTYNAEDIDQKNTYAVGVRITDSDGNLIYISTSAYNVITHGNPSQVDVMVEPV